MMLGRAYRVGRFLPVAVMGRPLHGPERYQPFFIVGSGRCGTTLLRAMLEAHAAVHIPPETHILGRLVREYRLYSRLPWGVALRVILGALEFHPQWDMFELPLGATFRTLEGLPWDRRNLATVLDAVYRAHTELHKPAALRWGDKTPNNVFSLPALRAVFPDLRVIHVLRDGRAVVESFMRLAPKGLAYFADHWLRAVGAARAFGTRYPTQFLEIRYEELVRDAAGTIQAVSAFLGLPFDAATLRHSELDLGLGDADRVQHLAGAKGPVHQRAIDRWLVGLDASQRAEIGHLLGPTLAALGYVHGES